jgi:hypothetical protein
MRAGPRGAPSLGERAIQKIILERQLADPGGKRLDIHRRVKRPPLGKDRFPVMGRTFSANIGISA